MNFKRISVDEAQRIMEDVAAGLVAVAGDMDGILVVVHIGVEQGMVQMVQ